jgi:multiple antibiotic resistance protein
MDRAVPGRQMTLFVHSFVTILVVMDPIGNVPVFLALTRSFSGAARQRAAIQATVVAGAVVLGFALVGRYLLSLLGVSLASIEVGGGLVLALAGLQLLLPGLGGSIVSQQSPNVALVPIGTPLLAGPGAIAATLVYMHKAHGLGQEAVVVSALVATLVVVFVVLWFAGGVGRLLRESATAILSSVFGLILVAIAVQMMAGGARSFS